MKRKVYQDITQTVISDMEMRNLIGKIFPDSIILDKEFQIFSICNDICFALGFRNKELLKTSFFHLLYSPSDFDTLKDKLMLGHFDKHALKLKCKNGKEILFSTSGFYLGLISDMNDLIVIKLKNMEEIQLAHRKLEAKDQEMDDFVYHAAHSLRGPLATLKGLIYLAQNTKDLSELTHLITKMNVFAKSLDEKLSKLVSFAESDKSHQPLSSHLTMAALGEKLKVFAGSENEGFPLHVRQFFTDQEASLDKGDLVHAALHNIVSFFLQRPRDKEAEMFLSGTSNSAFNEFEIRTQGIEVTEEQKNRMEATDFGYVEIMNDPDFASLYAAKKIVLKLKGRISLTYKSASECCVYVLIPKTIFSQNVLDTRLRVYDIFQTLL